jgi:hypothetical protein
MQAENFLISKDKAKTSHKGLDLRKIVSASLGNTTFHSVSNIYHTTDLFLKVVLFVCFVASGCFCCFLTVKAFVAYFSFGVLTSTNVVSDIPAECMII